MIRSCNATVTFTNDVISPASRCEATNPDFFLFVAHHALQAIEIPYSEVPFNLCL